MAPYGSDLVALGALSGVATANLVRKEVPFSAGIPQHVIEMFAIDEGGTIKVTLLETPLESVFYHLGLPSGDWTNQEEAYASHSQEFTFTNNVGTGAVIGTLLNTPYDGTSPYNVVVRMTGSPFTEYTEGHDWSRSGRVLTALPGNSMPGGTVAVTCEYYTYTPAYQQFTYGGRTSVRKFSAQLIHPRPLRADGSQWYDVIKSYRCVPKLNLSKGFNETDKNTMELELTLMADTTRTQGDWVAKWITLAGEPWSYPSLFT